MSDPALNQTLFGVHGAALELRSLRMGLLTSNIANASTPGYKARDVDFGSALNATLQGTDSGAALNRAMRYRVPVMPAQDGNTVELDTEQVAFSENAIGYSTALQFLSQRVDEVTRAIKGE